MFKRTKVCAGVLAAMGGGLALVSTPLLAQQQTAQAAGERVEITGSRIKSFETDSSSPVVTLGAESIKVEGVRNVEQLLNNLPQVLSAQASQVSNGSTGTATVDLRGLGSVRNLVLINGRRLPYGDPRDPSIDLNQIPLALIRRVEIQTGGASAVYGSDAVAGVINFILNDRFEGIQLDYDHQFYNHHQNSHIGDIVEAAGYPTPGNKSHDGTSNDWNLTMGGNFAGGKGNATVFLGYKKEKPLLQSHRDFSACALGAGSTDFVCSGSSTTYPGRFVASVGDADKTIIDAAGTVRDFNGATDLYNFGPINYFRRPSERYNVAALTRYDFAEQARLYTEFNFHDDRSVAQIAPSGAFFGNPYTVTGANPFLSPSFRDAFGLNAPTDTTTLYIGRRNVEGGGRQDDLRHTSYRAVIGLKGDVSSAWSYDTSAQIGKVLFQQTYFNDFSIARLGNALDIVTDANGNPQCRNPVDTFGVACVPYNIFQLGGVTQAALNYLQVPLFSRGETSQFVGTGSVTGDLTSYGLKSPFASSGVSVVFGAETRFEKLEFNVDNEFATGDGAGQGGPTPSTNGSYRVKDVFGELRIPLLEKLPGAEMLQLTGQYRHSKYNTDQKTNSYSGGLQWQPIKQVTLRGSYQRAVRAANVVELFAPQSLGLFGLDDGDPCAGASPAATPEQCARTGVTAAQYGHVLQNPAGQFNQITGGNPNLKPETAKTYTGGIILQPIRDLTASIDYFHIKIDDVISFAPSETILNQCLDTGNPAFCSLIQRNPNSGALFVTGSGITATNANLASKKTDGVDVTADYSFKIPNYGALDVSLIGTRLLSFKNTDLPGSATYDCAGYFGTTCGNPLPKWRHKLRLAYLSPWDIGVAATWRHLDKVKIDIINDDLGGGTVQDYRRELGQRNYLDLQASYTFNKNLTLRATVNNVLDKDPPLRTSQGTSFVNGNTYPATYDALGRQVTLSLTATY